MTIVFISVFLDKFLSRQPACAQTPLWLAWFCIWFAASCQQAVADAVANPSGADSAVAEVVANESGAHSAVSEVVANPSGADSAVAHAPSDPFVVRSAVPDDALTATFFNRHGWTGGDANYSLALSESRSLWLFGDTFIGTIDGSRRFAPRMVHNTAAWLDGEKKPLFFWNRKLPAGADLLRPPAGESGYYWPGALITTGDKLAIFCKRIEDTTGVKDGFGFDWVGQDVVLVDNPKARPDFWRTRTVPLKLHNKSIFPGSAAWADARYVYVFSTLHGEDKAAHPAVLERIGKTDLASGDATKFEYWCAGKKGLNKGEWLSEPTDPVVLFEDAAPEMSVTQACGLPGLWAIYSPKGLSSDILARHADRPEGPWSAPILLFHCPESDSNPSIFCYGAKAHPELTTCAGEFVVSYCLNLKQFKQHQTNPTIYFPHFIRVKIATRSAN